MLHIDVSGVFRSICLIAALVSFSPPSQALDISAKEFGGQQLFADIAARTRDGVVTVAAAVIDKTKPNRKGAKADVEDDASSGMGDFALGNPKQKKGASPRRFTSVGSGFIIDASGLVVTNNHVIEGGDEIYVILRDGTELKVEKVLGRDAKTDVTLLKVVPKPERALTAVSFGNSESLRVGDWVVAVGNPFGLKGTVTAGIISGKGRDISAGPYDEFLQTDASINRGNSGGPLFNIAGEVIGINTAIFSPSGGSIGIGFAIPSNTAKRIISQLKDYGETRWSFIGLRLQSLNDDLAANYGLSRPEGALVARVDRGGPAEMAGLQEGDLILTFAGVRIRSARELPRLVSRTQAGDDVILDVIRQGERRTFTVRVALLNAAKAGSKASAAGASVPRRQRAARQ